MYKLDDVQFFFCHYKHLYTKYKCFLFNVQGSPRSKTIFAPCHLLFGDTMTLNEILHDDTLAKQ